VKITVAGWKTKDYKACLTIYYHVFEFLLNLEEGKPTSKKRLSPVSIDIDLQYAAVSSGPLQCNIYPTGESG